MLFALDKDGIVMLAEGRGLAGLGLESDEVVGESIFDIYAGTPTVDDARRALDGEAVHSTVELDDRIFEGWSGRKRSGHGKPDDRRRYRRYRTRGA